MIPTEPMKSMKGKWKYNPKGSVCYSDPRQESYKKAAEFLGDTVEDWGCGTAWAKKFFKNYRGIDGSYHPNVDEVVDLTEYTSDVENILIRQVLELNIDWKEILKNIKNSFRKKLCLIIFTPFSDKTHILEIDKNEKGEEIPVISFNKDDIIEFFPESEFTVKTEDIITKQGYGIDHIFYITK